MGSDESNLALVCNLGLSIFAKKMKVSSDPTYIEHDLINQSSLTLLILAELILIESSSFYYFLTGKKEQE